MTNDDRIIYIGSLLGECYDKSTPLGKAVFRVLEAIAKTESLFVSQRIKEGLEKARLDGKTLGRPRFHVTPELIARVKCLREKKLSWKDISILTGVPEGTIWRSYRDATKKQPA